LVRAIFGEHQILRIKPNDKVVFSANAIPGSELNYYGAIDELSRNGVHVVYPDILPDLHQSGHGSAPEQQEIVKLVNAKYLMPIGGQDRHRVQFLTAVAEPLNYAKEKVLIPAHGEVMGFSAGEAKVVDTLNLRPQIVDGLGVGDVGPVVLSDRRALGQAGMVVVVMPRMNDNFALDNVQVISKGFVFMKEAQEVVEFIKQEVAQVASDPQRPKDDQGLTKLIEKRLARKLYKAIHREPMIVPVILDL
jgi:ribonuclease J